MPGQTVAESWWLSNIWRASCKRVVSEPDKAVIGILAFEVVGLMSKVVNLWHCMSDHEILNLREKIVTSLGLQKLVSEDDDYLMDLAFAEMIENLRWVAKSVTGLGKRCVDPVYHHIECAFDNPTQIDPNWCGWEYKLKRMEQKIKKMERFIAVTAQLYQELEVLAELEQSLRRMQCSIDLNQVKLLEFQQKVMCQRQEVKNLREMSPWVRSYDYTVRLLLRSLLTIASKIKNLFGINQLASVVQNSNSEVMNADCLPRSLSVSVLRHSLSNLSENDLSKFCSGPLGRSVSNLGLGTDKIRTNNKQWQAHHVPSTLFGKPPHMKSKRFVHIGPFKGCMMGGSDSPVLKSFMTPSSGSSRSSGVFSSEIGKTKDAYMMALSCSNIIHSKTSIFSSKIKLLDAPPSTLGAAALALHYANVVVLIEKLSLAPHLISLDARDDLYHMLPTSIRASLRAKLKVFAKTLASSVYDAALAAEWSLALARILEWLAPLAHNTIRWYSERNFEKQQVTCGMNVLLVQTLYFANQAKTEAAVTELLMGLNYISRFGREHNQKVCLESAGARAFEGFSLQRENIACGV